MVEIKSRPQNEKVVKTIVVRKTGDCNRSGGSNPSPSAPGLKVKNLRPLFF